MGSMPHSYAVDFADEREKGASSLAAMSAARTMPTPIPTASRTAA